MLISSRPILYLLVYYTCPGCVIAGYHFNNIVVKYGLSLADSGGGGGAAQGVRAPLLKFPKRVFKRDPPKNLRACSARGSRCAPPPSANPGSAPAYSEIVSV